MEGRGRDRGDTTNRASATRPGGRSTTSGGTTGRGAISDSTADRSSGNFGKTGANRTGGDRMQSSGSSPVNSSMGDLSGGTERITSSTERSNVPSRKSSGTRDKQQGLGAVLERMGLDETVVDVWRNQAKGVVTSKINQKVHDFDVEYALDRAREYATMSADTLKNVSRKNPTAFFSGIAAVLVGAGLIAAAASKMREDDDREVAVDVRKAGSKRKSATTSKLKARRDSASFNEDIEI